MNGKHSIKIAPWQASGKASRAAPSCKQQRTIAKAPSTIETDIFALGVNFLDTRINHLNILIAFCSSWIREELFQSQFVNGKLLESRRIDGGMALLSNHNNTAIRSETACLHCSGKSSNTIANDHDIRTLGLLYYIGHINQYLMPAGCYVALRYSRHQSEHAQADDATYALAMHATGSHIENARLAQSPSLAQNPCQVRLI